MLLGQKKREIYIFKNVKFSVFRGGEGKEGAI